MCSGKLGEPGTWNAHPHVELASVKHSEFWSGATWVPGDYGEQSIRIEENISSVNTFSDSVRLFQGLWYNIQNKETVYPESFLISSFPLNKPKKSAHCGHSKSSDSSSKSRFKSLLSHVFSGWIWLGKVCSFRCHVSWEEKIALAAWLCIYHTETIKQPYLLIWSDSLFICWICWQLKVCLGGTSVFFYRATNFELLMIVTSNISCTCRRHQKMN